MNVSRGGRGADALVQALQRAGVRRIFALSGNHVMPVFDALVDSGIELVHTRHEASCVHMADAWARLTGEVGIALVTGGPGHANAVSALYTARMAEAPVVLLSGHAPTNLAGMGPFQEMAQAEMAAPVCKAAWTSGGPDALARDLARAIRLARSGRPGPVQLNLPSDALEGAVQAALPQAADFVPEVRAPDPALVDSLLARLRAARRPVILVGPACMTRAARADNAALEAALGVPVVGMESPRGMADPSLGAFAQVLARADCVLLVGKRVDFTLKHGAAPFPVDAEVHQIDADDEELARSRRALGDRLRLTGLADAGASVQALRSAALAAPVGEGAHAAWCAEVRDAIAWRPPAWRDARAAVPGRLHPVELLRPLQAVLDSHPDAVLVCDGGEIGQWAMACLSAPRRVNNGVAGSIGSGLPYAVAARCAEPEAPVVAVMGDGTVGFHIAEFDTAVRLGQAFVAVVGNDARWNAEYQIQLREYGATRTHGCELLPTRYDQVAQAFGGHGEWVTGAAQLPAALERALASGRPACVNVMIEGAPAPLIARPA